MQMREDEFDHFLKVALREEVEAHREQIDDLETRVILGLTRPQPKTPQPTSWGIPRRWALAGVAAAFVVGIGLGAFMAMNLFSPPVIVQTIKCTEKTPLTAECRFWLPYAEASDVAIAGDFTGWKPVDLKRNPNGTWEVTLDVPIGMQRFAYSIDQGKKWTVDPHCTIVPSFGGTFDCEIQVTGEGKQK